MSKQTKPIRRNCMREACYRDATIGIYRWRPGDTDVNLDHPVAVVCGQHKPRHLHYKSYLRNVRIAR